MFPRLQNLQFGCLPHFRVHLKVDSPGSFLQHFRDFDATILDWSKRVKHINYTRLLTSESGGEKLHLGMVMASRGAHGVGAIEPESSFPRSRLQPGSLRFGFSPTVKFYYNLQAGASVV